MDIHLEQKIRINVAPDSVVLHPHSGVTEPAIYSIAVPNMKLFACAWVGGGISGAILGGLGAKLYALAGDGLFRIPGMINPAGLDVSFYGFIACAVLAFGVSAVLAYIVQGKEEKKN